MGAISFSLDPRLAAFFQQHLGLDTFVETGTFQGETVAAMQKIFTRIHSVELSPELHARVVERFSGQPGIRLWQGEAGENLRRIREELDGPALYWLDAHWCVADGTSGEISQCPLLEELGALSPLRDADVVLIDDARLFLAPPGPPHEISCWPGLADLLPWFSAVSQSHSTMVLNDVFVIYPHRVADSFRKFAAGINEDLLALAHRAKERDRYVQLHEAAQAHLQRLNVLVDSLRTALENQPRRLWPGTKKT